MSAASPAGPSPARAYPAQAYPAWTPGTQVHTTQRVPLQRPPPHRANAAERLLHDHVGRLVRSPGRWVGLILHLSRLPPPGPRPHHRRVAQALLHDSARRHDGQVYALRNGDLVLLTPSHAEPPALAELLHRLLHVAAEQDHPLVSVWPMADT